MHNVCVLVMKCIGARRRVTTNSWLCRTLSESQQIMQTQTYTSVYNSNPLFASRHYIVQQKTPYWW